MADNYPIKDATNTTISIASSELSAGVHSPKTTVMHSGSPVGTSNPLPVNVTTSATIPVNITTSANLTVIGNDSSPVQVKGNLTFATGTFIRPNDSTAYAIGDAVANSTTAAGLTELPNALRVAGGSGYIVRASFATDQKSNPSSYRIHIYNNATATVSNDNTPRRELFADLSKRCCDFVIGPLATPADTTNSTISRAGDNNLRHPISAQTACTSLWYEVEALTANTPVANQTFTLRIAVDNN